VPLDVVQRGMQQLIVNPAVQPCADAIAVATPSTPIDLDADETEVLAVLDTLGTNDVVRTDEADEATENDDVSVDSPGDSPPVTPPPNPSVACIKCERPLRSGNMVSCGLCGASFHTGCMTSNSAGKCFFLCIGSPPHKHRCSRTTSQLPMLTYCLSAPSRFTVRPPHIVRLGGPKGWWDGQ